MKIYVCVKHVPDSAATIKIRDGNRIDEGVTFLLNPYDENAVEAAVQLKSEVKDAEVIAVCLGKEGAADTLRSALAMGVDRGILVTTDDWVDSLLTARVLKAAMLQDGLPGIIFSGKVAIDSEGFQTMFRLAALLDLPVATNVVEMEIRDDAATVESEMEAGGRQVIRMPLPCVIGAGKALNNPRYPTLPDIMKARKKEIKTIPSEELAVESPNGRMEIMKLRPAVEERRGKIMEGTTGEAVKGLIQHLREEAKVI
jgi:electron transfer flavoprotein beta subunit